MLSQGDDYKTREKLIEDLVSFIRGYGKDEGNLFVNEFSGSKIKYLIEPTENFSGFKIHYNRNTGTAKAIDSYSSPKVNVSYSKSVSKLIEDPVLEAIALYSKIKLLEELDGLGDPHISNIIRKNHFDQDNPEGKCTKKLTDGEMTKTVLHIMTQINRAWGTGLNLFKPADTNMKQKIIYDILSKNEYQMDKVISGDVTKSIMDNIKAEMEKLHYTSSVPNP